MRSRLRELLDSGKVAVGTQARFGSPAIVELLGAAGFDWVLIDTEHAPQTEVTVQAQLQAIDCTGATPVVRPLRNDPDLIRSYLDMGAMGIVVPFVNTAEEARMGARACRYPPDGTRGWGPARAAKYGLEAQEYTDAINDTVAFIPIIETAAAVDNIDEIMAVDGVDACTVGPADLSISLGVPFEFDSAPMQEAVQKVLAACERANKVPGVGVWGSYLDPASVTAHVEAGFRLILLGGDEPFLAGTCRQVLDLIAGVRQ